MIYFLWDCVSTNMPRDNSFNKLIQLFESIDSPITPQSGVQEHHHEGGTYMAKAQIAEVLRNAEHLMHLLEELPEDTCLEPWQQSKLTLANDYLEAVKTAMLSPDSQEPQDEIEIEPTEIEIEKP